MPQPNRTAGPSSTLRRLLSAERRIVAFTGAGVSAESGLSTFRGPDGLWRGRDPATLATPEAFAADPDEVWRFYGWRRERAHAAEPNAGHRALARIEAGSSSFTLITQNVDGLHERAGSRNTLRLHGSLWRLRCVAGCGERDDTRRDLTPLPPRCDCGAMLRPGVVWFGESLDSDILDRAAAASQRAELMIVAGTSALVYPAAALPGLARRAGAYVVEINPETTPLTPDVDEHLAGPSGEILPVLAELFERQDRSDPVQPTETRS